MEKSKHKNQPNSVSNGTGGRITLVQDFHKLQNKKTIHSQRFTAFEQMNRQSSKQLQFDGPLTQSKKPALQPGNKGIKETLDHCHSQKSLLPKTSSGTPKKENKFKYRIGGEYHPYYENQPPMIFNENQAGWDSMYSHIFSPFTNRYKKYITSELRNKGVKGGIMEKAADINQIKIGRNGKVSGVPQILQFVYESHLKQKNSANGKNDGIEAYNSLIKDWENAVIQRKRPKSQQRIQSPINKVKQDPKEPSTASSPASGKKTAARLSLRKHPSVIEEFEQLNCSRRKSDAFYTTETEHKLNLREQSLLKEIQELEKENQQKRKRIEAIQKISQIASKQNSPNNQHKSPISDHNRASMISSLPEAGILFKNQDQIMRQQSEKIVRSRTRIQTSRPHSRQTMLMNGKSGIIEGSKQPPLIQEEVSLDGPIKEDNDSFTTDEGSHDQDYLFEAQYADKQQLEENETLNRSKSCSIQRSGSSMQNKDSDFAIASQKHQGPIISLTQQQILDQFKPSTVEFKPIGSSLVKASSHNDQKMLKRQQKKLLKQLYNHPKNKFQNRQLIPEVQRQSKPVSVSRQKKRNELLLSEFIIKSKTPFPGIQKISENKAAGILMSRVQINKTPQTARSNDRVRPLFNQTDSESLYYNGIGDSQSRNQSKSKDSKLAPLFSTQTPRADSKTPFSPKANGEMKKHQLIQNFSSKKQLTNQKKGYQTPRHIEKLQTPIETNSQKRRLSRDPTKESLYNDSAPTTDKKKSSGKVKKDHTYGCSDEKTSVQ